MSKLPSNTKKKKSYCFSSFTLVLAFSTDDPRAWNVLLPVFCHSLWSSGTRDVPQLIVVTAVAIQSFLTAFRNKRFFITKSRLRIVFSPGLSSECRRSNASKYLRRVCVRIGKSSFCDKCHQ